MFLGNWNSINISGSSSSHIKRHAGPLTFPTYKRSPPKSDPTFTPPSSERSFYNYFSKLRHATDVTTQHLDLLNVSVENDVPITVMLGRCTSNSCGGSGDESAVEEEGKKWLPPPNDATWVERQRELSIENEVAVEVLCRTRRDISVGYMFRFFQAVEMVRVYYKLPTPIVGPLPEDRTNVAILPSPSSSETLPIINRKRPAGDEALGIEKKGRGSPPSDTDDECVSDDDDESTFSMPERFREELIASFVEPICWGYGVKVFPPRAAPKLQVQKSKFSVNIANHVYLTPTAPAEARSGFLDGPVMGLQARHEYSFRALSDPYAAVQKRRKSLLASAASKSTSAIDLDAIAAKAERRLAASEAKLKAKRTSSSKTDRAAKKKKGTDEVLIEDDKYDEGYLLTDEAGQPQDVVGVIREIVAMLSLAQMRAREASPGSPPTVERRIRLKAIGKAAGSYWDDIFMVTSIHHHISISCLRVSKPYLRFVRTGRLPRSNHPWIQPGAEGEGWEKLRLEKTRYWSLLVPEERVQAAEALSAALNWCTRDCLKPGKS